MDKGDGDEEIEKRIIGTLLQGGDVFAQRVLIGTRDQRVVAVEDSQRKMVWSFKHQTQAKTVVTQILGDRDDLREKVRSKFGTNNDASTSSSSPLPPLPLHLD